MAFADVKRILLIQLGDIGDLVWTTPTIWAVKAAYPQADLFVLMREGFGALLEAEPAVSGIFEVVEYQGGLYERMREQYRFIRDFRRRRFDLAIDLRAGDRGAVMARLSGAPVRAALYYRDVPFWRNHLFTHLVQPRRRDEQERGAAEQSLGIVRSLGMEPQSKIPRLQVSEKARKRALELLQEAGLAPHSRWVSLNPFSRWPYKELPGPTWTAVIDWLGLEYGLPVIIVGASQEEEKADALAKQCGCPVVNLAGRTDLAELAALLSFSSLHLGVDSAAPQIAAAVGTATLTVYGPSDWHDWAPSGQEHRVVAVPEECAPCHRKGCNDGNVSRCLAGLSPEEIKKSLSDALACLIPDISPSR